jgi:hypothetical protein
MSGGKSEVNLQYPAELDDNNQQLTDKSKNEISHDYGTSSIGQSISNTDSNSNNKLVDA